MARQQTTPHRVDSGLGTRPAPVDLPAPAARPAKRAVKFGVGGDLNSGSVRFAACASVRHFVGRTCGEANKIKKVTRLVNCLTVSTDFDLTPVPTEGVPVSSHCCEADPSQRDSVMPPSPTPVPALTPTPMPPSLLPAPLTLVAGVWAPVGAGAGAGQPGTATQRSSPLDLDAILPPRKTKRCVSTADEHGLANRGVGAVWS